MHGVRRAALMVVAFPLAMGLIAVIWLSCALDCHQGGGYVGGACMWCLQTLDDRGVAYEESEYAWLTDTL